MINSTSNFRSLSECLDYKPQFENHDLQEIENKRPALRINLSLVEDLNEIFFLNNPRIKGLISPLSSNSSNISDDLIMNEDISSLLVECSENNYSDVSPTLNYSNTEKSSNVFDSFNSNFNLMTSLPTSPYQARVFGYRTLKTSDELELEYREDIYDKNLEQKERTPKNPS